MESLNVVTIVIDGILFQTPSAHGRHCRFDIVLRKENTTRDNK